MNPTDFLTESQRRGFTLSLDGDRVKVRGRNLPKGVLPYLQKNKAEIVSLLRGKPTGKPSVVPVEEKVSADTLDIAVDANEPPPLENSPKSFPTLDQFQQWRDNEFLPWVERKIEAQRVRLNAYRENEFLEARFEDDVDDDFPLSLEYDDEYTSEVYENDLEF